MEILGDKYSSRRTFPSIVATCKRFGISRLTAFKVFDKLKDEGLISSCIGSGTFVTNGGRSRLIGLVIPGVSYSSEFFQPIVAELVRLAHKNDYTILMEGVWSLNSCDNSHEAIEVAARLIKRRVAGVIYQPLEYNDAMIAGFDDVQIARLATPGITTIRQPCAALARASFERLQKRISGSSLDPVHIVCPFKFVERGTTDRKTERNRHDVCIYYCVCTVPQRQLGFQV
jgi:DNA-binding LacI/PurR family transcriptional regulator